MLLQQKIASLETKLTQGGKSSMTKESSHNNDNRDIQSETGNSSRLEINLDKFSNNKNTVLSQPTELGTARCDESFDSEISKQTISKPKVVRRSESVVLSSSKKKALPSRITSLSSAKNQIHNSARPKPRPSSSKPQPRISKLTNPTISKQLNTSGASTKQDVQPRPNEVITVNMVRLVLLSPS